MSVSCGAAPRPPVPGEEGGSSKAPSDWSETLRRSDLGSEPEGSAWLDVPYEPWAETLLTLLDDRDGTALFLRFLRTLGCSALLEFWFACSGFRKIPEVETGRRLRLAKAMYRCYLCDGTVSREVTADTRSGVRDAIGRLRLHQGVFTQAQAQVQAVLQDTLFPAFLRSHLYTRHTHKSSQGAESENETRPPPSADEERRHSQQHHKARQRHTHLPHTPVKMTTHTFAAELMRRLQELQTHTHTQTEEETVTSAAAPPRRLTADSGERETSAAHTHGCVTVVYSYSTDMIPYRTCVRRDPAVTLGLFRTLLTRRGPFRFFFKTASAEFDCGAVYEEIREDEAVLPTFEQKIVARVERVTL